MSRTHKDAPRKVRERRAGLTRSFNHDREHCDAPRTTRTVRHECRALFAAHEREAMEAFREVAEEHGFNVSQRELWGHRAELLPESRLIYMPLRIFAEFKRQRTRILYSDEGENGVFLFTGEALTGEHGPRGSFDLHYELVAESVAEREVVACAAHGFDWLPSQHCGCFYCEGRARDKGRSIVRDSLSKERQRANGGLEEYLEENLPDSHSQ